MFKWITTTVTSCLVDGHDMSDDGMTDDVSDDDSSDVM